MLWEHGGFPSFRFFVFFFFPTWSLTILSLTFCLGSCMDGVSSNYSHKAFAFFCLSLLFTFNVSKYFDQAFASVYPSWSASCNGDSDKDSDVFSELWYCTGQQATHCPLSITPTRKIYNVPTPLGIKQPYICLPAYDFNPGQNKTSLGVKRTPQELQRSDPSGHILFGQY